MTQRAARRAARAPAPRTTRSPTSRSPTACPPYYAARRRTRPSTSYLMRPAPGARRLAAQRGSCARRARSSCPPDACSTISPRARAGQRGVDHDGVHPAAARPDAATRSSATASCRSSPTRPAPSAWTRCSASSRSTPTKGQKYEPVDHELLLSYTESQGRPDPRGGHHRGRLDCRAGSPAGTVVRQPAACRWCRSSPSIRCSASSGSATSSGRPPTPAHAASCSAPPPGARRCSAKACSTRTATAWCSRRPYPLSRPTTRRSPTSSARSSTHGLHRMYGDRAGRRGRLLLPHPLQRELRDAGHGPTTWSRRASSRGIYLWADAADELAPRRPPSCSRDPRRAPPAPRQDELRRRFGVGAELWSVTSYKRLREDALAAERWNRLHPEPAAHPARHPAARRRDGPIVAVTDFMKLVPDQIARWVPPPFSRSAPTASAAATPARRCAASSRSTPATSSSPCCPRWPRPATSSPKWSPTPSRDYDIDPDAEDPPTSTPAPVTRSTPPPPPAAASTPHPQPTAQSVAPGWMSSRTSSTRPCTAARRTDSRVRIPMSTSRVCHRTPRLVLRSPWGSRADRAEPRPRPLRAAQVRAPGRGREPNPVLELLWTDPRHHRVDLRVPASGSWRNAVCSCARVADRFGRVRALVDRRIRTHRAWLLQPPTAHRRENSSACPRNAWSPASRSPRWASSATR